MFVIKFLGMMVFITINVLIHIKKQHIINKFMRPAKFTFKKVIKLEPKQSSRMKIMCDNIGITENEYIRMAISNQIKKDIAKIKKDNV